MRRILRPFTSPGKRPLLALIALLLALSLLFSDYTAHHDQRRAMGLEDVYDPPDRLSSPSSFEAEANAENASESRVLLVSALFSLPQGNSTAEKEKREQRLESLSHFLAETETDVYIFTTPQLGPALSALLPPPPSSPLSHPPPPPPSTPRTTTRQAAPGQAPGHEQRPEPHPSQTQSQRRITIDTTYTSPFDIPPLKGREAVYRFALRGRVAPGGIVRRRVGSSGIVRRRVGSSGTVGRRVGPSGKVRVRRRVGPSGIVGRRVGSSGTVRRRVGSSGKVRVRRRVGPSTNALGTDGLGYDSERVEEVYAARNARPFLVGRAVEALREEGEGRGEYGFVFWCDSAMLGGGGSEEGQGQEEGKQQPAWGAWPDVGRVRRVWEEGTRVVGASSKLREAAGKGKGKGEGQGSVGKGREEAEAEEAELMFIPIVNAPPRRDSAWTEEMGPLEGNFALAFFFGGPPPAVKWFSRTFYAQHDYFLRMGYASTVSSSTSSTASTSANTNANANTNAVFNSLLVLYPHRFITVWPRDPDAPARLWGGGLLSTFLGSSLGVGLGSGGGHLGACGEEGEGEEGYVRWWLAGREVRERWRAYWLGEGGTEGGGGGRSGRTWTWTWGAGTRTPCRLTGVLGVEDVLGRVFGRGWSAPSAPGGSGGSGGSASGGSGLSGGLRPSRVW